jgi:hypothetical protein
MSRVFASVGYCLLITLVLRQPLAGAGPSVAILDNPQRQAFTGFASSLAVVGDTNGDGVVDYLIGAYGYRGKHSTKRGRAFVLSGRNGASLLTIDLPHPSRIFDAYGGAAFGCAVAAAGDVDHDGIAELLIGAFGQEGSGQAYVFHGKTGKLLHTLQAPQPHLSGGFGWSVASLRDLTGDGIAELVIGAIGQEGTGRVYVFNGANGTFVYSLGPPAPQSSGAFGWSVADAGDLDRDGASDILVGAPYTTVGDVPVQGRVYTFSGRTGKLHSVIDDPQPRPGEVFGWHVASAGDLNKDGIPEILVGAPYKDVGTTRSEGAAFVINGADGQFLLTLRDPVSHAYAGFGLAVAASLDLTQDGIPEIVVGAPYQTVDQFHVQGEVFLFDGANGRHLSTFDNPLPHQGSAFGYTVVAPGDVNGDTIPDFGIGAAGQTIMADAAAGRVYLFLSRR